MFFKILSWMPVPPPVMQNLWMKECSKDWWKRVIVKEFTDFFCKSTRAPVPVIMHVAVVLNKLDFYRVQNVRAKKVFRLSDWECNWIQVFTWLLFIQEYYNLKDYQLILYLEQPQLDQIDLTEVFTWTCSCLVELQVKLFGS